MDCLLTFEGVEYLKQQLEERLKRPPMNFKQFLAWESQAENAVSNGQQRPHLELKAHETISGRAELIEFQDNHFQIFNP